MYTIKTDISDDESSSYRTIKWFNLSTSPFEHHSPERLFSPTLSIEILSPPDDQISDLSPHLWDDAINSENSHSHSSSVNILRDCYIFQIYNILERQISHALEILIHRTTRISSRDMQNIIDNAISNEVMCCKLSDKNKEDIKRRIKKQYNQSLSSSPSTTASAE
jgi:hypothetical protein